MNALKKTNVARIAFATFPLVLVWHVSGCTATASSPSLPKGDSTPVRQFIVKFKPRTLPCTAAGIDRLSADAGVRLAYVRPMSGDACVVRQIADKADAASGEQRIRQHPATEWVEADAVMKAF